MKKLFLTFAILLAFVAAAHAQSTSDGNYTNNDTLFRFIFKSDSIYIMSNDVKGYEKHTDWTTYHLTTKKYRQLNNIKVKIGENVLFSEKTPDGQWERIPVFYSWRNNIPTGRFLLCEPKSKYRYNKIVSRKGFTILIVRSN
ncbi:MAG: hypothetical protein II525_07435 [Bacteroidales bacterium]|nr:hypothetical protein [Bacteroidales bacterium]